MEFGTVLVSNILQKFFLSEQIILHSIDSVTITTIHGLILLYFDLYELYCLNCNFPYLLCSLTLWPQFSDLIWFWTADTNFSLTCHLKAKTQQTWHTSSMLCTCICKDGVHQIGPIVAFEYVMWNSPCISKLTF